MKEYIVYLKKEPLKESDKDIYGVKERIKCYG